MPVLTVILAPAGPAAGVLDALQDLSGAGLLDPFLWVSEAAVTDATPAHLEIDALSVAGGRRACTSVQDALVDHHVDRVRLGVLVPLTGGGRPVAPEVAEKLTALVGMNSVEAGMTRVRCLLSRGESSAPHDVLAQEGWHNVLIAAEDSAGPGQGHTLLAATDDPIELGRHAAPVVAGLLGLWSGVERSCLDGLPIPPGRTLRAARAFYRRVDAQGVERELRRQVLATQPALPLPRDHDGTEAVFIDDVGRACRTMAERLWHQHQHVLRGFRVPSASGPTTPVGFRTAVVWLPGFILATLRNAYERWWVAKLAQFSVSAGARAHRFIVDREPVAYEVFVRGVTPQGVAAGWRDFGWASERLDNLIDDPAVPAQHTPRADLTALWKDYAAGALTLADAGGRGGEAMPPVQIGARRGVLRSAADCVPAADADFAEVPAALAAMTATGGVQVGDILGADLLRLRLHRVTQDHSSGSSLAAGRTVELLTSWSARYAPTYCARVGGELGRRLTVTVGEVQAYLSQLREAAELEAEDADRRHRLRTVAQTTVGLTGVAVAGLVMMVVLVLAADLSVSSALMTSGVIGIVWVASTLGSFVWGQRELFSKLTRRRELRSGVDAVQANLRHAVQELRRLSTAYTEFLLWSRVLGVVLHSPFGTADAESTDRVPGARGMPRTTRVARAVVDEVRMSRVAVELRRNLFTTGWLSTPWETNLTGAAAQLGRHDLAGNPDLIVDGALLQSWTDQLVRHGPARGAGVSVWSEVTRLLVGPRRVLGESLLAVVRGAERGSAEPERLERFLSGIDVPHAGQRFGRHHFTDTALAAERSAVDIDDSTRVRTGLSRVDTLVQLTHAWPPWDFVVGAVPDSTSPEVIEIPSIGDRF